MRPTRTPTAVVRQAPTNERKIKHLMRTALVSIVRMITFDFRPNAGFNLLKGDIKMATSRSGNGWLWAIGIALGLVVVGAAAKSVGDVDGDGDRDINDVIGWLNQRFGKRWVSAGLNALLAAAPAPFGILLPIVFQVEQEYAGRAGVQEVKKQRAVALRRQRGPSRG